MYRTRESSRVRWRPKPRICPSCSPIASVRVSVVNGRLMRPPHTPSRFGAGEVLSHANVRAATAAIVASRKSFTGMDRRVPYVCRSPCPGPRTGLDRCSTSADTRHVATNSPVPHPWRRHRTSRGALLASAILAVAGCDDSTGPARVASVQVIPAAWTFTSIGDTVRFRAEAKDAGGGTIPGHTFRWRADPTGVVGIRQDGLATALRPGVVVISGTADSVTGTANAGVVQAVSAVHASAPSRLTAITDTGRLSFTAVDAHGYHVEDATFSFQSLNEPVATVSPAGTVRAVAPGVARIVVTSSEASDTVTVEVYQFVASIEVTPDSVILEDGTTRQLTAVMKDWK